MYKSKYVIVKRSEYEKLKEDNRRWRKKAVDRYVHGNCLASMAEIFWDQIAKEFTDNGETFKKHVDFFKTTIKEDDID